MTDAHMVETLRLRTAALHRVQRSNDQLRRVCLDREATEQDVRARLADAEKALAEAWDAGALCRAQADPATSVKSLNPYRDGSSDEG